MAKKGRKKGKKKSKLKRYGKQLDSPRSRANVQSIFG